MSFVGLALLAVAAFAVILLAVRVRRRLGRDPGLVAANAALARSSRPRDWIADVAISALIWGGVVALAWFARAIFFRSLML